MKRIITAKNHASVQINIENLDQNGVYDGNFTTFSPLDSSVLRCCTLAILTLALCFYSVDY